MANRAPPLENIRIITISQFGAGPFGTMMLADLGAEVIKIEDPSTHGDVARTIPPRAGNGDSLYFQTFNRNKKSLLLDLKTKAGKEIFNALAKVSNAVFNNLRPDVAKQLGLIYDELMEYNPAIVTCSLSGFGSDYEGKSRPGYDPLIQAETGYMSITGGPHDPPTKSGVSTIDFAAGFAAALALISGIYEARESGIGRNIDLSLFGTSLSMLSYMATWMMNSPWMPSKQKHSGHQTIVPAQNFRTQDGWLAVFCAKESFWLLLIDRMGLGNLKDDSKFTSFTDRYANKDILIPILEDKFLEHTNEEWMDIFGNDLPVSPINNLEQVLGNPDLKQQGFIERTSHNLFGNVRQISTPFRTVGLKPPHLAPKLGQHNEQILRDLLGFSNIEIRDFASDGAFG